jgi:hypothetical protein
VYVDANPACNTLLFQMTPTAIGTTLATRQWNIKASLKKVESNVIEKFKK